MSDEVEVVTEPATPEAETPTLSKDAIAAALGVEVSDLDKLGNLKKWESDINRMSSELGARKKADEPKPAEDDDLLEWDEKTNKSLKKWLKDTLGVDPEALAFAAKFAETQVKDEMESTIKSFFSDNPALKDDEVFAVLAELPPLPENLSTKEAKKLLNFAKDVLSFRASAKDTEDAEAKVLEKAEKLIEDKQSDGSQIVSIKRKASPLDAKKSLADFAAEPGDFFAKLEAFSPE